MPSQEILDAYYATLPEPEEIFVAIAGRPVWLGNLALWRLRATYVLRRAWYRVRKALRLGR